MRFMKLHGVEHFLIYTFGQTDDTLRREIFHRVRKTQIVLDLRGGTFLKITSESLTSRLATAPPCGVREVLSPYLQLGWASRIHFLRRPQHGERQHALMEDCLYRAKGLTEKPWGSGFRGFGEWAFGGR